MSVLASLLSEDELDNTPRSPKAARRGHCSVRGREFHSPFFRGLLYADVIQACFSRHVKFELVNISSLPKSIACTEHVSYCNDLWRSISLDEGTCRRDVSQRFVASCASAFMLRDALNYSSSSVQ